MDAETKFWQYFESWVFQYKKGNVRDVTLKKYFCTLESLKKIAHDLNLKQIDRKAYQEIINTYSETHEKVTVADFHHHLKACLDEAVENEIIPKNPANRAMLKGKEKREQPTKCLSQFETRLLIRSLNLGDSLNLDYLVYFLVKSGVRFSEALGITPADFDFDTQTIFINKTYSYKDGSERGGFAPTKNKSSIRRVPLDWGTMRKFSELIYGMPSDKPIFLHGRKNLCNSTINIFLHKKCKEADIPLISVHGLRHTHASLLLDNGVSVASVAKRLGHSNMATTQKVYLHIIEELENKDNAIAIASMLNLG